MEILQFLLSFFIEEYGAEGLSRLLKSAAENGLDIKSIFPSLNANDISDALNSLFNNNAYGNKKDGRNNTPVYGVTPLKNIADKELLTRLENYVFSGDNG